MKKILALLLVAVMCLSFVACNSNSDSNSDVEKAEKDIVGEWVCVTGSPTYIFNEDGTGSYYDRPMRWKYDSELSMYIICETTGGSTHCTTAIQIDENGEQYIYGAAKAYRVEK